MPAPTWVLSCVYNSQPAHDTGQGNWPSRVGDDQHLGLGSPDVGPGFSHGIFAVPYFVVMSLGLSALTLMDGRLELAIGAHAANNISFLLARLFSASAPPQLLFDDSQLPASAIIVGIIQSVLVVVAARWIVQRGERRRLAMAPDR